MRARTLGVYVLMGLIALLMALPILYTISTAFKPISYVLETPPRFIPSHPTLQNFVNAWNSNNFGLYFMNSLEVALLSTIGTVLVASSGAYAFARLEFPFKNLVFRLYLLFLMIPSILYIIPQFILAKNLGLLDKLLGLVVFYIAGNVAFHTFFLRSFFEGIPKEVEEAAQIDGASRVQSFFRIALPLAAPAIGTSAIFAFLGSWDEFTLALTFLNDGHLRTLPIAIRLFQGQHASQWGLVFAASLIAMVPVVLVYVFFQQAFVRPVDTGGLKG
ncbi:MAG TPA: carbohydrate ABC transporter permease [Meiothermus sp.]|jgi:multiple sugar transport system permease protein|nr:carbohydrate ABC transporter permease [Meiothermus sp.]